MWRHGGHVGGQEYKHFSPLGTKLYFLVNSSRKYSFVLTPNMAALSRGCKARIVRIRGKSSQPRKITFPRHILLVWWRLCRQKCSSNLHELACSQVTLIEITVLISGTLFELSLSITLCCHSLNLQADHGGTFIVKPPTKTWTSTYEHIRLGE